MDKSDDAQLIDKFSFKPSKNFFPNSAIQPSLHIAHSSPHHTTVHNGKHLLFTSQTHSGKQFASSYTSHDVPQNVNGFDYLQTSMDETVMAISREGLQHPRAIIFLLLWYFFSASTLFLNKYILSYQKFDPYLLCEY